MKSEINRVNHNASRFGLAELVTFVITLAIYIATLAPTVTGEDSGELIAAAFGKGIAHPPGYPLWTMLAALAIKVFYFGSVAFKVNLLSAVLSSLAAVILCRTMRRFFAIKSIVAVLGSISFACGRQLWSQSVIAEVYTLHVLLVCSIIYFALEWNESGRNRYLYILSLLIGLLFSNHHLAVLIVPLLFILVLVRKPKVLIKPKIIVLCLLFLALGLLPYIYMPLAASQDPYMNWGNPDNWERFVVHVLRKQYSDDSMHMTRTAHRMLGHVGVLWKWNCQQYSLAAIPFIFAGIFFLARRHRNLFCMSIVFFLMHTIVLIEILNTSFSRQELFCTQVFMLPAYIITAIWLTIGCQVVGQQIVSAFGTKAITGKIKYLPVLAITAVTFFCNYSKNDMSDYYYAHDHADNILNYLGKDAILIPSGDHNTFPVTYRHYVENVRPDIIIADKYGYIEYDLYKSMPNAPERILTHHQREEIEAHIIKESGRPVYYTVKPRLDLLPGYRAVSEGLLFRVIKEEESISSVLPEYKYSNLTDTPAIFDHAATVILSDYYFQLASNALRSGQLDQAMQSVEKAAQLSEGLKEGMNNLGTLLAEFGHNYKAINFYEEAARLDKEYLTPRWNLAYLFKAQGDVVPAIQVFNDMANIDPEDYRIFGELGFLLYQHGDTELAVKNWGKALALNPDQPQIIEAMSNILK